MSKRRRYSVEFKRGAVEQTRQPGVSCAQVARELGIGANLLTPGVRLLLWSRPVESSQGIAVIYDRAEDWIGAEIHLKSAGSVGGADLAAPPLRRP